jgi:ATP-dependent RNA helicase RhlE
MEEQQDISFEDLKLTRQFLNAIEEQGFTIPTPIQAKAIPILKGGQHLIGIAQTGTGKTAAYLLPTLQKLKYAQGEDLRALILVPTKELVVQVLEHIHMLGKYTDLRAVGLYGGVGRKKQAAEIHAGVDIVVATPMRLLELYEKENLEIKRLEVLILDEADRMLDMGFRPQINLILDIAPRKKQNMMFSATFSPEVEELSWDFMDFPVKIEITPEATPVETVEQQVYHVPNMQTKLNLLVELLKDEEQLQRVIIFVKTKKAADQIFRRLEQAKVSGEKRLIHSNKGQNTRINAFNDFKEGEVRLLISTDVMARGIDVSEVSHVVNFDVPVVYEDYVHRIGRTGRAYKEGTAITFVTKADIYHLNKIQKKIRMTIPVMNIPDQVEITETPFEENQDMEREIDRQKRKEDPNYKGAFHKKENYKAKQKRKQGNRTPKFSGKAKSFMKKSQKSKSKTSKHNRKKK